MVHITVMAMVEQLIKALRTKDWITSFIPFVIGLLFQWIYLFNIPLNNEVLVAIFLFSLTSIGFASLGYFVNEFFDIKSDTLAEKPNRLKNLKPIHLLYLLFFILIITFVPWIYLRYDLHSILLIAFEIVLFILYSVPFIRLKNVLIISNIIDTLYAYIVPILLSFYTFSLYSNFEVEFLPLIIFHSTFFFVGFRNILLHQIRDISFDEKSNIQTLATHLGVRNSFKIIHLMLILEIVFFFVWTLIIASIHEQFYVIGFAYLVYLFYVLIFRSKKEMEINLSIKVNQFYQLYLPLIFLIFLTYNDVIWIYFLIGFIIIFLSKIPWVYIPCNLIYRLLSRIINYFIFHVFLIFGVNLKVEKVSAFKYIKNKLR